MATYRLTVEIDGDSIQSRIIEFVGQREDTDQTKEQFLLDVLAEGFTYKGGKTYIAVPGHRILKAWLEPV